MLWLVSVLDQHFNERRNAIKLTGGNHDWSVNPADYVLHLLKREGYSTYQQFGGVRFDSGNAKKGCLF